MNHSVVRHGLGEYIIGTTHTNIPSAEQRADDERRRKEVENLSDATSKNLKSCSVGFSSRQKGGSDGPSELLADQ
jgi:hypothetical protein